MSLKFVSEEVIEAVIDGFDQNDKAFFKTQEDLVTNQLALAAVLTEDNLSVLEDDEYDLLWFMVCVLYKSISVSLEKLPIIEPKTYEHNEEENWEKWNNSKGKNFREKLNVFFSDYSQEDLLAFIEDSLEPDEDVDISSTGREVIFIICKSLVDSFIATVK